MELRFHRWKLAIAVIMAAMLLLAPDAARAQAGMVGRALGVCVLRDTGGQNPSELIRRPERFDCKRPQTDYGPGSFWVISSPIHRGAVPGDPLRVRVASLWQQGLDLYTLYGDGHVAVERADGAGVTRQIQLGAIVEQRLPYRDAPVSRVMWHVRDSANLRGILIGARIATEDESQESNLAMGAIYSGFAGLCIALIVYNLALWGALRHSFQLAYCAMVTGLLVYAFSSSGALAWVFPEVTNNFRLRVNYLMLCSSAGMAFLFGRTFFESYVLEGWVGRLVLAMAGVLVTLGVSFFLFAPYAVHVLDAAASYVFLLVAAALGPMLWRAWTRRSNYLWLFALAWSAPIVTAIIRALANLNLLAWNFWLDNSTILAMSAEALISSLAIAYRIRVLSRERDAAMAAELMARRLAETDPLTGLLNRRAFLDQAIGRPGEQMLLIADIDHFKRVNDTLGHDGGDEVLRNFARTLRASVPATALVARIGGEEFAIVTHADAPVQPEKILSRLRGTRMPFDLKVTASIGTCTGPLAQESDWKALYRGADAALFEAKSAGRDRVRKGDHGVAAA